MVCEVAQAVNGEQHLVFEWYVTANVEFDIVWCVHPVAVQVGIQIVVSVTTCPATRSIPTPIPTSSDTAPTYSYLITHWGPDSAC